MLNLGEVEIKGVDAVLNALFTLGKLEVTTKFQYTYQKTIDITDPADTYYRDQIPYIPWHSGSAILALFYKGWGLNYSFIYTGQRYNQQENIPRNHTQPWYTSDLSLQKTFKIRTRTLKATAEVNNLFGQDYDRQTKEILEQLDRTIRHKSDCHRLKEARIDSLKQVLQTAATPQEQCDLCGYCSMNTCITRQIPPLLMSNAKPGCCPG